MAVIAIYSMKGGVGKTTLAVNLACAAASLSKRRTLLWDLDAQAAASFILAKRKAGGEDARAVLQREMPAEDAVVRSGIPLLDVLPADPSLRALDRVFAGIDKKKRLMRLTDDLARHYDHVFLDCPPGLGDASEQVIRGADLILLPMMPSVLSRRAYAEVRDHLDRHHKGKPPIFPVFNMVDRRRSAHRAAMEAEPDYPVIPNVSAVEEMAERRAPVSLYAPRSPASIAIARLWTIIERRLFGD